MTRLDQQTPTLGDLFAGFIALIIIVAAGIFVFAAIGFIVRSFLS